MKNTYPIALFFALWLAFLPSISAQINLTRGPYLQKANPTAVTVAFRTSLPTIGQVKYGTTPAALTTTVNGTTADTAHFIRLTGLTPNTKYYYSVGTVGLPTALQGDVNNYFITAPPVGTTNQKIRVWAVGDCGNNSVNQKAVRDQFQNYMATAGQETDVWALLGDNAYLSGFESEFTSSFFDIYKDKMLKSAFLYPAPGNHDYNNLVANQISKDVPYYKIFDVPTNAECGGLPSGTEQYYSYNVGNIHFLSLDSYGYDPTPLGNLKNLADTTSEQIKWIKQDLEANTLPWVIAYWHHPPYTKTSHDSDAEADLGLIRDGTMRVLERYGVDLIMCGHSHGYERSALMNGHYGLEATFDAALHNVDGTSGRYDGSANSCPTNKITPRAKGTMYIVAGSAGQLGGTSVGYPHNAMVYSNSTNGGSLLLEILDNRLDGKFVAADGTVKDQFTMMKGVNKANTYNIQNGQSFTLTASFIANSNYKWADDNAITTRSRIINQAPNTTQVYTVTDEYNCVTDMFSVTTASSLPVTLVDFNAKNVNNDAVLEWKTMQEINSDFFEIQRSHDGTNFTNIGKVKAAGTVSDPRSYTFTDKAAAEKEVYYRLRQVDLDGKFVLSNIVALVPSQKRTQKNSYWFYPNPAVGTAHCSFYAPFSERVNIEIYDMFGKLLSSNAVYTQEGMNNADLDISSLPEGMLIIQVKHQNSGNIGSGSVLNQKR